MIKNTFQNILNLLQSDGFTYHCRSPQTDNMCVDNEAIKVKAYVPPPGGGLHIFFCDPFPHQNLLGRMSLIKTLLHEAVHAHAQGFRDVPLVTT